MGDVMVSVFSSPSQSVVKIQGLSTHSSTSTSSLHQGNGNLKTCEILKKNNNNNFI